MDICNLISRRLPGRMGNGGKLYAHSPAVLFTLLLLLLPVAAMAQVGAWAPGAVNYQGQLIQEDGTPLPQGSYMLTVTIHDSLLAGNVIWGPYIYDGGSGNGHASKVFVGPDGRFNVVLGERDTANRRLADAMQVLENEGRFIELQVGTDAPMRPRQRFLSAPYVIQAATATQIADIITTDGINFGLGTTPTAMLDINGDLRVRGDLATANLLTNALQASSFATSNSLSGENVQVNGNVEIHGYAQAPHILKNNQTTEFTYSVPAGTIGLNSVPIPGTTSDAWYCSLAALNVSGSNVGSNYQPFGCQVVQSGTSWLIYAHRFAFSYNLSCTAHCFKFK